MNAYMTEIKIATAAVLLALVAFGTWYATSDHYEKVAAEKQIEWDKAVQAQIETNMQLMAANAALRKKAGEDHAKDQLVVNDLTTQLGRVRIHIPGGCAVSQAGAAGADPNGGGGLLSERVDAAFEHFQSGTGRLIQRCDQLNIDARQANAVNR